MQNQQPTQSKEALTVRARCTGRQRFFIGRTRLVMPRSSAVHLILEPPLALTP